MKFRLSEIDVPEEDPFKNDALKRQPVVEFLRDLIKQLEGPFVLALDSPWGTGKTTVVRMLRASLKNEGIRSVYFNAWKEDYVSDPLIPMVAAIDELQVNDAGAPEQFSKKMVTVKQVASKVVKRGLAAAVKLATMNAVNLDEVTEDVLKSTAGDVVDDVFETFKQEKASLECFREALEKAVNAIGPVDGSETLVFFIDELDRCRPTFAIELLERVKHLFDVKQIVFVLSIDKKQLEAITKAVYGESIDAPEYLRRFIDLDFSLPMIHDKEYIGLLFKQYEFSDFFSIRRNYSSLAHDEENFKLGFTLLSNVYQLSLRSIERCFSRVASVLVQTQENEYLDPIFLAYLVIIKAKRPKDFSDLLEGRLAPADAMREVKSYLEIRHDSRWDSLKLEAYLLAGDPNEERKKKRLDELTAIADNEPDTVRGRDAANLLQMQKNVLLGSFRLSFSYVHLAKKVDISIQANQRWDE